MALYVPLSRRRRNAALVALATLVAGLAIGYLVGRYSAVTASESSAAVHDRADTLATRIEALTIEYDQAVSGSGDTIQGGVLDALDGIDIDLDRLIADSPWMGVAQQEAVHQAAAAVRADATAEVSPETFSTTATTSADVIRQTFGVDQ